jgi:predicted transposase YdaD
MQESTTYQAILKEGLDKGLIEGRNEGLIEGRVSEAQ